MHTAVLDIQRFIDSALSKVNERRVDLVYLPKRAHTLLGIAYDPIYSHFLKWDRVVELGGLLFGSETTSFTDEQPEWLQAGALFTELCVEQCKRQAQESLHEHIWREGELIGPTGPHEYLGFARACFNSGLCEAGSDSEVAISKEDWPVRET
jgi:hypothetical protein